MKNRRNGRLQALDGSYYRIARSYRARERPEWLGDVNFGLVCMECGEILPEGVHGGTVVCSPECALARLRRRKKERR